jgi:hypothetical protein
MNTTLLVGLIVSALAFVIFSASVVSFFRKKTLWSFLQLFGAAGLLVVGLCHVCEALQLFPWMHWGFKRSVGHCLDLASCILGLTLLPGGYIGRRLFRSPA